MLYQRVPLRNEGDEEGLEDKVSTDNIVDFDGADDVQNPKNWSSKEKTITTLFYSLCTLSSTWASAAYSPVNDEVDREFQIGGEVAVSGTSLLLFGWVHNTPQEVNELHKDFKSNLEYRFGFGPLVWAPLSEIYGRKWPTIAPCFIAAFFSFATASAKDIQTVLITRFLCGFFGAAPIVSTGGVLADLWDANHRGYAIAGYSLAVAAGPVFGPVVGGAIIVNAISWRWTEYITGIIQITIASLGCIFISESYAPRILAEKARSLRLKTGHWALHARFEEYDVGASELLHEFGLRPVQLLFTPICGLIALYASFIYGVFYSSLASFPIIFQVDRGWDPFVGSLPFLALLVGILLGSATNIMNQYFFYNRRLLESNGKLCPENRLLPMMFGSFLFPAGLSILGWSSKRDTHWTIPTSGAVFVGFAYYTIFQAALNYLVDTFERWGASAIAANTFLRSILAAAFPAIVIPMYKRMGTGPASSVFAGVAALMIPIPFAFWRWGEWLRARGQYSASLGSELYERPGHADD